MKKIYVVKPKTEIELQFEDGKTIKIVFDARAVAHFTEFNGLETLTDSNNYEEICSLIVYAGAVENNENFTLDIAKALVSELDLDTLTGIISDFTDSLGSAKKAQLKEQQKNQMSQFQAKAMSQ